GEEPPVPLRAHLRVAELAYHAILDGAAQLRGHRLHSVADAQHRRARLPCGLGRARRSALGDALRAARKDDPRRREIANERVANIERLNLAVDVELAHAARNQLGVLRSEIEDQDLAVHGRCAQLARATRWKAKCRRARKRAAHCSAALTKNVAPTRQSDAGSRLTCASSGVPIAGAMTNMMLWIELSAPIVTPCSRAPTAFDTMPCSAGPAAKETKLPKMIAYIIQPCCARPYRR